jgi:hypothetical protein
MYERVVMVVALAAVMAAALLTLTKGVSWI